MTQKDYQNCMAACFECAVACRNCANQDLNESDIKMLARCIRLDGDCSAICFLAISAMAGGSEFAQKICQLCAEICDACAEECGKHTHMEHCKRCAEACRKCANECRKMVAA